MKTTAVRLYGTNDLRMETFELPPIKEDEILVKIISDSICMSSYKAVIQGPNHKRVPKRVMMQTESYPRDAWRNYRQTMDHSYIFGDFVWTGLDYLGESGIGRYYYEGEVPGESWERPLYPWHAAYCGDVDFTGMRKPISHYRAMLWNETGENLFLAVREPDGYHGKVKTSMWSTWPTQESWTWPGWEGKPIEEAMEAARAEADRVAAIADNETNPVSAAKAVAQNYLQSAASRTRDVAGRAIPAVQGLVNNVAEAGGTSPAELGKKAVDSFCEATGTTPTELGRNIVGSVISKRNSQNKSKGSPKGGQRK